MKEEQRLLLLQSSSLFAPPEGLSFSFNQTRSVVGFMITDSHNKVTDNGVKIVDPSGGMLSQEWEPFAYQLAKAETPEALLSVKVVDRTAVTITNAETMAVSPPGIQEAIDAETAKYLKGRCFIPSSGTVEFMQKPPPKKLPTTWSTLSPKS